MSILSRRNLLQRLGLLLGTAAASLVPGSAFVAAAELSPAGKAPLRSLDLYGRGWHLHTPVRARGELPRPGDRMSVNGILLDALDGQEVGTFYSACFCPDTSGRSGLFAAATLEMHTFTLTEGSIIGIGIGGPTWGQTSRFAVVGGTGRFAGARGDYTSLQRPVELAGSGRAEFYFTFLS